MTDVQLLNEETYKDFESNLGDNPRETIIEFWGHLEKNIDAALNNLDGLSYKELGFYCHRIKSNIGILGGEKLEAISIQVERHVNLGETAKVQDIADEFIDCCRETRAAFGARI